MMGLQTRCSCTDDSPAAKLRRKEEYLHSAWGLGSGPDGAGYRERLSRLCQFLQLLGPERDNAKPNSDLSRLRNASDSWRDRLQGADNERLRNLEELQKVLKRLERTLESEEEYLKRFTPVSVVENNAFGTDALKLLRIGDDGPAGALKEMDRMLSRMEREKDAGATQARERWKGLVQELIGDWEWARLQVLVQLGRSSLEQARRSERQSGTHAEAVAQWLTEAIEKLEKRGSSQPARQGLYGLLAESTLLHAKAESLSREKRLELIQTALTYARRGVEIDPANVNQRRVLIETLSHLGDFDEVKTEADVALDLNAGAETLRTIGSSFWNQMVSLSDRKERANVLQRAAEFFESATRRMESEPLDKRCPLEQIETHGWTHYWLGRFQGEIGKHDQAAMHLRTAAQLGFKPFESRVLLGWILLDAKAYDQAARAFQEAQQEAGKETVDDPFLALGLAFLALAAPYEPLPSDSAASLAEPEKSIAAAETLLSADTSLKDRSDLQGLLHEARGRALLGRNKPEAASELERAVYLNARSSAYRYLTHARLERAAIEKDEARKSEILAQAWEAYESAVRLAPAQCKDYELTLLEIRLQRAQTPPATTLPGMDFWSTPGAKGAAPTVPPLPATA